MVKEFAFKVGDFKELAKKIIYYQKNKKDLKELVNQSYRQLNRLITI